MAITVKKKRITTVKTVKAKANPDAADAASPAAAASHVIVQRQGPSYTPYAIVALIATLLFVALLTMQALELSFYYSPDSVFVRAKPAVAVP